MNGLMKAARPVSGAPASREANALEVERLSVRLGKTTVLDALCFEVPRATSLAIIGPNGAGKTALFEALIGALPHEGTVRWETGTRLGYVPQQLDIEQDLGVTGEDFLQAKAIVTGAEQAEVESACALVSLPADITRKRIDTLSGGQFQRLLVAAALLANPNVLLLDEPAAGVSEPRRGGVGETIERLRCERGLTVLLISHDLSVVYRYASNVLCLARGRACFGAPKKSSRQRGSRSCTDRDGSSLNFNKRSPKSPGAARRAPTPAGTDLAVLAAHDRTRSHPADAATARDRRRRSRRAPVTGVVAVPARRSRALACSPGALRGPHAAAPRRVTPLVERASRVTVELRVDATDELSWAKFRGYFLLVGPGSRIIRRSILAALARAHGTPGRSEATAPLPTTAGARWPRGSAAPL
jgi:zinc transport system ATP-binding protein